MNRRTEKFLKETRQRELDKYDLDRTPTHTHVVNLGPFGKIPVTVGWPYPGLTVKLRDIAYYEPVSFSHHAGHSSTFWNEWGDVAGDNHASRIQDPVVIHNTEDYNGVFDVHPAISPDRVILDSESVLFRAYPNTGQSFSLNDFRYEIHVNPIEYVIEPVVWREECGIQKGVERWLLRVEHPQWVLDAAGNESPYGDPDLEWL